MENLPEFQGMCDNIQTILEKFVKIDQNLFMEIIEKRSSSSHVFTILEYTILLQNLWFLSFGFWYFGLFNCMIFFLGFFQSCPSCLAKCKQRLHNIFVLFISSSPKMNKISKQKMIWMKHLFLDIIFFKSKIEIKNMDTTVYYTRIRNNASL